jgi:hypothetical protein
MSSNWGEVALRQLVLQMDNGEGRSFWNTIVSVLKVIYIYNARNAPITIIKYVNRAKIQHLFSIPHLKLQNPLFSTILT